MITVLTLNQRCTWPSYVHEVVLLHLKMKNLFLNLLSKYNPPLSLPSAWKIAIFEHKPMVWFSREITWVLWISPEKKQWKKLLIKEKKQNLLFQVKKKSSTAKFWLFLQMMAIIYQKLLSCSIIWTSGNNISKRYHILATLHMKDSISFVYIVLLK